MSPLEVNKKIAEIKGVNNRVGVINPDWSGSISGAWELFEEMPHNTKALFWHDVHAEWECALDWHRASLEDCKVKQFSETAPMAICLAWIEWRENGYS